MFCSVMDVCCNDDNEDDNDDSDDDDCEYIFSSNGDDDNDYVSIDFDERCDSGDKVEDDGVN